MNRSVYYYCMIYLNEYLFIFIVCIFFTQVTNKICFYKMQKSNARTVDMVRDSISYNTLILPQNT